MKILEVITSIWWMMRGLQGRRTPSRGASLGKDLGVRNRSPAKPDTLDTRKKKLKDQTGR